jgi:hypothetical protein
MARQQDFSRYVENHLSARALKRIITENSPYSMREFTGESYETVGLQIARSRSTGTVRVQRGYLRAKSARGTRKAATSRRPSPAYWGRVRDEFHKLVCTKDPRYAALRRQLAAHSGKTQTAIVSFIAAYVASILGLATGAVVPLVALCLLALLSLGRNAFCDGLEETKVR